MEDIHPENGRIDIAFNGQVLSFDKIKKAIYRYDTTLLNDMSLGAACLDPTDRLRKILRRVIVRCVIEDRLERDMLRSSIPKDLIDLLLATSCAHEVSNSSAIPRAWSLKTRSGKRVIEFPNGNEYDAFASCIKSISCDDNNTVPWVSLSSAEVRCRWKQCLKDLVSACQLGNRPMFMLEHLEIMGFDVTTEILMVALSYCILSGPESVLSIITFSAIIDVSGSLSAGLTPLYNKLLEILLVTAVIRKDIACCERLMSTAVNLNAIHSYRSLEYSSCVDRTILQISLEIGSTSGPKDERQIPTMLLVAGADPNLCGRHRQDHRDRPFGCKISPLSLALTWPHPVVNELLKAGARVPKNVDLTDVISEIKDPMVLSILLQKGASPEGSYPLTTRSEYFCPLQAALSKGNRELTVELLKSIDHGSGCKGWRERRIGDASEDAQASDKSLLQQNYRTPFTFAVLHHFLDIAIDLLGKGADPNGSYFDEMLTRSLRRIEAKFDLCPLSFYVRKTSTSPLQAAVLDGDITAVGFCLEAGADPDYAYPIGISTLAVAMCISQESIFEILLDHNAHMFLEDLYLFVRFARKDKAKKYDGKEGSKERLWRVNGAIHALEKVIRELELDTSRSGMGAPSKRQFRVTTAQFHVLRQGIEPWLSDAMKHDWAVESSTDP